MRLVRLKLRPPTPFWILNPIHLSPDNIMSDPIDVDNLAQVYKDIINRAMIVKKIIAYDQNGELIKGDIDAVNIVNGNFVGVDDVEEEPDLVPQMISVTVENPAEEIEEEEDPIDYQDLADNAQVLLNRNGNTVRKTVENMPRSKEHLELFKACLDIESSAKNRASVIKAINIAIAEY